MVLIAPWLKSQSLHFSLCVPLMDDAPANKESMLTLERKINS